MQLQVYSKTGCPYCAKAKSFLMDRGIAFFEVVLDEASDRQALYDRLGLVDDSDRMNRTVPQIVLVDDDGEVLRIGGWDKLVHSGIESLKVAGLGAEGIGIEGALEIHARRVAARSEPTFTLKSSDMLAPEIVQLWIERALPHLGERHHKIISARQRLAEMQAWQEQHGATLPD